MFISKKTIFYKSLVCQICCKKIASCGNLLCWFLSNVWLWVGLKSYHILVLILDVRCEQTSKVVLLQLKLKLCAMKFGNIQSIIFSLFSIYAHVECHIEHGSIMQLKN
jgi:hypothetical protein